VSEPTTITVEVLDGIVDDISGIPEGVQVKVVDRDTHDPEVRTSIWTHEED